MSAIITVGGSFTNGLVISGVRPQQRGPDGKMATPQQFVLTPDQSKTLLLVLETKWKVEQEKVT